ncbi:hypothetical protein ES704_00667 [subsurface metagenome]|jgi:hypothetical protein
MKKRRINYFKNFSLFFAIAVLIFIAGCNGTAPIINSFSALPSTITEGESSTLSWSVTDATSVTIDQSIGSVALIGTTAVNPITTTTYTLTATNAAGSVTAATTITVNPATLEITQTEGTSSAWFGASPTYVNVGQGQSFQVTEAGFFDQFQIYLTSTSSSDSGDIIVCNLRDASGNVLQSAYNSGFTAGNGGWQTFNFNLGTSVTPGTYYCTCYVNNPIEDHYYHCHGNSDGASYPEGTRYDSRGGNPEDWSTWNPYTWDLVFKVIIKISP